jgi:hypothetical protein
MDAVVTWFKALPWVGSVTLLVAFPLVGLALAAGLLWRTWTGNPSLHADVAALARAGSRFARRPAFLVALLVLAVGAVYFLALAIHAIVG